MKQTRRTYLKGTAASALIGIGALSGLSGSAAAESNFDLEAGFADTSWLDDDVDVHTITEPTRSAVESAFSASGARVVVFETSGTIDLGGNDLAITEDYCWVAGQTAPSPGITFINGQVRISANNCVVQHIRSRIGPGSDGSIQSNDAFNTADGTQNNVVDHVSASWGTDECLSVGYDTQDTTVTNCLIYEGLYDPYGNEADHNYGSLIGDGASNVTLAGNVWGKVRGRAPRLKSDTETVVVNNLLYFFDESANADDSAVTSFVGNAAICADDDDAILEGSPTAYHADNIAYDPPMVDEQPIAEPESTSSPPLWPSGLSEMPSGDVESHNLTNAGARPADRTQNDARIVQEIADRAGLDYLDSPYDYWVGHHDEVGGYPELPVNTHSLEVPDSGIRDWLAGWAQAVEEGSSPPDGGSGDDGSSGPIPTGTYEIANVNSGQLLEVADASTADGANVQQWSATDHATQQWYVEDTGNGEYVLQNANSGLLLEVADGSTEDGANVQQHADTGCDCQRWSINDVGNGEYILEAVHSGKVADVEGASTSDGANVLQWPDTGGANQRWTFDSV
ncbi:Ricin B lectin (plasmid) [Haloterrigena turkmenica DSM 5511]|uniref:Ricin B lectin n=1 Tax=Haloterrigena turkmenica (strain ATCC 51198 / DSM 5511 / JCM 9101 / NCIMB 13204 / VKM B-1734 / 4k) TaxID=543526 RepID=D2S1K4_HALTV|nr:RICIN domain-containing protein [Haloterrigena turkmenica]ADB63251.1 Ricin B lectin [Haloterrigena turkmenica DSM 5511]